MISHQISAPKTTKISNIFSIIINYFRIHFPFHFNLNCKPLLHPFDRSLDWWSTHSHSTINSLNNTDTKRHPSVSTASVRPSTEEPTPEQSTAARKNGSKPFVVSLKELIPSKRTTLSSSTSAGTMSRAREALRKCMTSFSTWNSFLPVVVCIAWALPSYFSSFDRLIL